MKNKSEISVFLDNIDLSLVRSIVPQDSGYIFDTQMNAAKEVVACLACNEDRSNHVILLAKMQSGKTGTCNAVTNYIMNTSLKDEMRINKVMYITGMNDCGLAKQTYSRVLEQVSNACERNTLNCTCRGRRNQEPMYYILKNSNLRHFNGDIRGSLIFIDEAHFGSKELNVLTSFMNDNGIDWRNNSSLMANNIYIVSVSATPFDEIVSDTLNCKPTIELHTDENYIGVSEYFERDLIHDAERSDVEDGTIIDYIADAHNRMKANYENGIVIVRTRNFEALVEDDYIKSNFSIHIMDSSDSKIDYDSLDVLAEALIKDNERVNKEFVRNTTSLIESPEIKPLLVLIKGAFRAGITIKPKIKDIIYMVYDYSSDANATAQALLGRMCGYRDIQHCAFNTHFYVNKKFAKMYADWENDFNNKTLIPSNQTQWVWVDNSYVPTPGDEVQLGTKPLGNFTIDLLPEDLKLIYMMCSRQKNKPVDFDVLVRYILNKYGKRDIKFDYIFDSFMKGKQAYAKSTQEKRFEGFSKDSTVMQFRPQHCRQFIEDTGRDYLTNEDIGKKGISVVFDIEMDTWNGRPLIVGNRRLLVYYFEVAQKKKMINHESLYRVHKDTAFANAH